MVVCSWAIENGHLEVLKWVRENGCPWDEDSYELPLRNGDDTYYGEVG